MWQSEVMNRITSDEEYWSVRREWQQLDRRVYRIENDEEEFGLLFLEAYRERRDQLQAFMNDFDNERCRGRVGPWIPTFTGGRFWLLDPRPEDFNIVDIAHCLAHSNRWCGGTIGGGYSVGQHSVHVSEEVDQRYALAALLHDAPEAYHGDCITPMKDILGDAYSSVEEPIMCAIAKRYGFAWDDEVKKAVKKADLIMLATEARDLVPTRVTAGRLLERPRRAEVRRWSGDQSFSRFLSRFNELTLPPAVSSVQCSARAA